MSLFQDAMKGASGESDFAPMPEGDYNIQCETAGFAETKTGKEYFKMTFIVLGPTQIGRKIIMDSWVYSDNKTYVKRCWDKIKRFTVLAGVDKDTPITEKDMPGLKAAAKVKIEESEGYDPKNVISHFKKPVDLMMAPSTSGEAKQEAANFASDDIPF